MPPERWLPRPVRRSLFNAGVSRLTIYPEGFNGVAAELGVEGATGGSSYPPALSHFKMDNAWTSAREAD